MPAGSDGKMAVVDLPAVEESCTVVRNADNSDCQVYHLVLRGHIAAAAIPITGYKGVVIKIKPGILHRFKRNSNTKAVILFSFISFNYPLVHA